MPTDPGHEFQDVVKQLGGLRVIYQLATEFAVCDRWFSSLPGPTWPNRFFVHGASSAGLDHSPAQGQMAGWETPGFGFTYPHGSVFDALSGAGLTWRIYNDDTDAYSDDPQDGLSSARSRRYRR
jgi:phospholipase C